MKSRLILQVHDELVFEAPVEEVEEVRALIKTSMEEAVHFDVDFLASVGVGDNWAEAH